MSKNARPRKRTLTDKLESKLLHQILTHSPHACTLAIDVHWDGEEQTAQLNAANGEEDLLGAVGIEPAVEEEGEDEAVEDVYKIMSANYLCYTYLCGFDLLLEKLSVTSASPAYCLYESTAKVMAVVLPKLQPKLIMPKNTVGTMKLSRSWADQP